MPLAKDSRFGPYEIVAPIGAGGMAFLSRMQWDVTRDGRRFLFLIPAPQTTPVPFTVVLNWEAALFR